jgi:NitT/TauT family transport system ATP-binding protein
VSVPLLEVVRLSKTYDAGARTTTALGEVSFWVDRGEFLCIVGPSGCGKTTLLKCMAGLLRPSAGQVRLGQREVVRPPREMALVFQQYERSLYPWMTVRRNVRFPLKHRRLPRVEAGRLVEEAVEAVGLTEFIDHYPWQLSGGMQQRVALARALAYRPEILLMDEPFASVDAQTRAELEDLALRIRRDFGITVVFVTHDIDEAIYLGDRVIVLTPSPARVHEIVTIDLPEPRDQLTTKGAPRFIDLRARLYTAIARWRRPATSATPG